MRAGQTGHERRGGEMAAADVNGLAYSLTLDTAVATDFDRDAALQAVR